MDGVCHDTFQEACYARGIIARDNEWELCEFRTGWYLRRVLISAMVYGGLADAKPIWEKFKGSFCEGLGHIIDNKGLYCDPSIDRELDYGLFLIHTELLKEEVDHEDTPLLRYNLPKFAN